jgi:hypothetical protein
VVVEALGRPIAWWKELLADERETIRSVSLKNRKQWH